MKLIVATDGESMESVGDVGVQAIGGPISKLSLYTACAGVAPAVCLPVCIDMGTDNEELLMSPFYVGARHRCEPAGCELVRCACRCASTWGRTMRSCSCRRSTVGARHRCEPSDCESNGVNQ